MQEESERLQTAITVINLTTLIIKYSRLCLIEFVLVHRLE